MPSEMAHQSRTRLKPQEAALLAGEVQKPSWQSKNEGIHERVSFEDSIWGFDLAGGSFYKTPLRVTAVKPDSRAEKAGIRPGDRLLRINDIDTSTLTIQEAHEIIIESGVHLRIAVTAPEDLEDSYHCWEDEVEDGYDSEEERRIQKEKEEKRRVHCKVSSYWSLQWPWVSKRRVIYRESNCFLVPSKYENIHKDKFTEQPVLRTTDDVVLQTNMKDETLKYRTGKTPPQSPITNGIDDKKPNFTTDNTKPKDLDKNNNSVYHSGDFEKIDEEMEDILNSNSEDGVLQEGENKTKMINGDQKLNVTNDTVNSGDNLKNSDYSVNHNGSIENIDEEMQDISNSQENNGVLPEALEEDYENTSKNDDNNSNHTIDNTSTEENLGNIANSVNRNRSFEKIDEEIEDSSNSQSNDDVLQEVLKDEESISKDDQEKIFNEDKGNRSFEKDDEEMEDISNSQSNNSVLQEVLEKGEESINQDDEEKMINDILGDESELMTECVR